MDQQRGDTMQTLPLFYYPTKWVWVDDDSTLLDCMVGFFSEHNRILAFDSPTNCLQYLQKYRSPLSEKQFIQCNFEDENCGLLQYTPLNFNVTDIAKMVNDKHRYDEITALVIDYHMPEMDGFTLAQALKDLDVDKILLTGQAQDQEAIHGLNDNLIHRFVRKGETDMEEKLLHYLKEMSYQYFQKKSAPLISLIEAENKLPLSDPAFINFFKKYCHDNQICEYYLIDKEGSYLCIDKKGNQSCLVIQTDNSIENWLTSYSASASLSPKDLHFLQTKNKIPFFGVSKEAWQFETHEWASHFYPASILDGRERYYWASLPA